MIKSSICCSSLGFALAESTSFLWNSMNLLKCFRCVSAACIDNSRCRNVDDTVYLVWLLISFIECEFSIIFLIMSWIASMRLLGRMFLVEIVMWFFDRNILICSRRRHRPTNSWKCFWYFDFWSQHWEQKDRSRCTETVTRWLEYNIWKIYFAWVFRQNVQIFSIVLMFLICRYYCE